MEETQGRASSAPVFPAAQLGTELIERICQAMPNVSDRIALTSCCRELWVRPGLVASPHLWGCVTIRIPCHWPLWGVTLLQPWLSKRVAAICSLSVADARHAVGLQHYTPLFVQLAGGALRQLKLHLGPQPRTQQFAQQCAAGFDSLCLLRMLTSLSLEGPWSVALGVGCPSQLGALTNLVELRISRNHAAAEPTLMDLTPLSPTLTLTRLTLHSCALKAVPPSLAALTQLADLDLSRNQLFKGAAEGVWGLGLDDGEEEGEEGGAGGARLDPWAHLSGLTRLNLAGNSLPSLPRGIRNMRGLAALELGSNFDLLDDSGTAALQAACRLLGRHCTALTYLGLSRCALWEPPPSLSCLRALAELDLRGNPLLVAAAGRAAGGGSGVGCGGVDTEGEDRLARVGCALLEMPALARVSITEGTGQEHGHPSFIALEARRVRVQWDSP